MCVRNRHGISQRRGYLLYPVTTALMAKVLFLSFPFALLIIAFDLGANNTGYAFPHCIDVYSEPSSNSRIIQKLDFFTKFEIIKTQKNRTNYAGGVAGKWILIKTRCIDYECSGPRCEELKCLSYEQGWIFDSYLYSPSKFQKVTKWRDFTFSQCVGDYCPQIAFRKNGSYSYLRNGCVDGISLCQKDRKNLQCARARSTRQPFEKGGRCTVTGHLFRYQNFLMLKHFGEESHEFLRIKPDGSLTIPVFETCIFRG